MIIQDWMKVSFDGANYNIYINKKYIDKLTICFIFKKKIKISNYRDCR